MLKLEHGPKNPLSMAFIKEGVGPTCQELKQRFSSSSSVPTHEGGQPPNEEYTKMAKINQNWHK